MSSVIVILLTVLSLTNRIKAMNQVCYYDSLAATTRTTKAGAKFFVSDIDARLCTHYVYAYAILNGSTNQINSYNPANDINNNTNGYLSFTGLKSKNSNANFLLALGGKVDSNDNTNKYSNLVSSDANIQVFVNSVIDFLNKYKFDGLSLDWLFPSTSTDFSAYSVLVVALKSAFKPKGYLLASTVSAVQSVINSYNVSVMNQNLDLVFLNTYDYHTPVMDKFKARHPHPLYCPTDDPEMANRNVNHTVHTWLEKGLSPRLIQLGMPLYGWGWAIDSSGEIPYRPPAYAIDLPEENPSGIFIFADAELLSETSYSDPDNNTGPYTYDLAYNWIAYDDVNMAKVKANYILKNNLGGAMLFDISQDDFQNKTKLGINPLITAVNAVLNSSFYLTTSTTSTMTPSTTTTLTTLWTTTIPPYTTTVNATTNRVQTSPPSKCPSSSNAILPDSSSCRQFYICLDGVAYSTSCHLGKYFNAMTLRCEVDDPTNAKCPSNNGGLKKAEILSYNAVKYDWKVHY